MSKTVKYVTIATLMIISGSALMELNLHYMGIATIIMGALLFVGAPILGEMS